MSGDRSKDRIQRADAELLVGGNDDALMRGGISYEGHVAPDLPCLSIVPSATESANEFFATQVSWELHWVVRTSSRTR